MAGALRKLDASLTKSPDVSDAFAALYKDELSKVETTVFEDMPFNRLPGLAVSDFCAKSSNASKDSFKLLLEEIYKANALTDRGKNSVV